ncbi:translesion DNA synthesis-associated protein ImuA [Thalassotalea sediminis]|uniref:translesion DNA synthesis-associated protein ImuA n=1 Tax=Thalassotalea sediminis TaxID=1759089 RepID=UPI0025747B78|nr:translesion DNA synthesis-associated protein ImuA [Thalassotalea sediminis]
MNELIELLQHQHLVWQGSIKTPAQKKQSTGFEELDQHLDGGFLQGVTEIRSMEGIGELRLLLPTLKYAIEEQRLVVFIAPRGLISPQMLVTQGFDLQNFLLVYPDKHQDALWTAEQCLRSGVCHSVVMWFDKSLAMHQIKRLQIASEAGNSHQFILRTNKQESLSLPVELSLSLKPHPQGLIACINKRKGGWPSDKFIINMEKYWPMLTLQPLPNNLVPFPKVKVS